jgi:hypothetical protein
MVLYGYGGDPWVRVQIALAMKTHGSDWLAKIQWSPLDLNGLISGSHWFPLVPTNLSNSDHRDKSTSHGWTFAELIIITYRTTASLDCITCIYLIWQNQMEAGNQHRYAMGRTKLSQQHLLRTFDFRCPETGLLDILASWNPIIPISSQTQWFWERLSGQGNIEFPGVHIFPCVLLSSCGGTFTLTHCQHTTALPPDSGFAVFFVLTFTIDNGSTQDEG